MNNPTSGVDAVSEYLTFRLGVNEYGLDILAVREIRAYGGVTELPQAPEFIKGVIDLRGLIIPVVDLRVKFGMDNVVYDGFTVMIVMAVGGRVVAAVVDSVSDVVRLSRDAIAPPPQFGSAFDARYLRGMAQNDNRMLIVLDIEQLLGAAEIALYAPQLAA